MKELGLKFGSIISFLLPGFILLLGIAPFVSRVGALLRAASDAQASVGSFLFILLLALALGLMLSAVRWLTVDQLLSKWRWPKACRILPSDTDCAKLKDPDTYSAFTAVVENHYNFYQYYSNALVAVVATTIIACAEQSAPSRSEWIGIAVVSLALLLGARDAFGKYHRRAGEILGRGE